VQPAAPPPWRHARDWDDYRHQAALRIMAVNPEATYTGPVHQPMNGTRVRPHATD
jgi:hypothetical protein